MSEPISESSTSPPVRPCRRWRRGGRAVAALVAGLLVLGGCAGDAGVDGEAPDDDGAPPQDPDPEVQENAPNVEDPDLSGDETPEIEPPEDVDGDTAD